MHGTRRIALNVGALGASGLLARGSGLLISAYLARHLGEDGYGTYRLCIGFAALFAVLARLGIRQVVLREISSDPSKSTLYVNTGLWLHALQGGFALLVILIAAKVLGYSGDKLTGVLIMGLATAFMAYESFLVAIFEARERMEFNAGLIVVRQLIWIGLAVGGVILGRGFLYFHSSLLVTAILVVLIAGAVIHYRFVRFSWVLDASVVKRLYQVGLPLAAAAILVDITLRLDLIMLDQLASPTAVGYYAACTTIVFALFFLNTSITTAVYPIFSRMHGSDSVRLETTFLRTLKWVGLIVVPISASLSALSHQIITLVFGANFAPASTAFAIAIWVVALQACAATTGRLLVATHRERSILAVSTVSVIVNAGGNLLLIPRFGIEGAAIASVGSMALVLIINLAILARGMSISKVSWTLLRLFACGAIVAFATALAARTSVWLAIPVGIGVYLVLIIVSRIFDEEDWRILKSLPRG